MAPQRGGSCSSAPPLLRLLASAAPLLAARCEALQLQEELVPDATTFPPNSEQECECDSMLVSNVRGERFPLVRPGRYRLLQIPASVVSEDDTLLKVTAKLESAGPVCDGDLYITQLHFSGVWLLPLMNQLELNTNTNGSLDARKAVRIRTGLSADDLDLPEAGAQIPEELLEITEFPSAAPPQELHQNATTLRVTLRLDGVVLTVRTLYRNEGDYFTNSFWITGSGLLGVNDGIGGLLGLRDRPRVLLRRQEQCAAKVDDKWLMANSNVVDVPAMMCIFDKC